MVAGQPAYDDIDQTPTEPSMRIDAISIGIDPPREVNVIIEVPVGGEPIKYEMDKDAGTLVVDRFLYTAMRYPGNYGFIPHTLSNDGDPCDVLVANTRAIVPGAVMSVRPVGVLLMEDEAGGDEKIIAVPSSKLTQRYDKVKTYSDLPEITLQQIQHFFEHYKDLEPGKWVKVLRWGGPEDAHRLIAEGIARAKGRSEARSNLDIRLRQPMTGYTAGVGRPVIAQAARRVLTSRHATVIWPTPPGTGVIAPATFSASAKATSPTSRVLPSGPGSRLMPTSITVAPGLIQSPRTISGLPTAA